VLRKVLEQLKFFSSTVSETFHLEISYSWLW